MLTWLEGFPGDTWQQRWEASPVASDSHKWEQVVRSWAEQVGRSPALSSLSAGLLALIAADVVRPELAWLNARPTKFLRPAIAAARDPEGFARLEASIPTAGIGRRDGAALKGIAQIVAAYGGAVEDIVVGDVLALWQASTRHTGASVLVAYRWLRDLGQFPSDAPVTLRSIETRSGQVSPAALVDRFQLQCKPVRDLIVEYLI
ncbi:hypothetical protein [Kitasatospora herbaricolor]|uniref:Uncharacterized protein n=1 Tax=Kitasatospora herbaricolor TaxID=68217 RepID=A0ABZ1W0N7_9ACTN|nr:hypothetical protein [Kitasatospora herbaricolor]